MNTLMEESYKKGYDSFPKLKSPPYLNKEFMETIPNCNFGDDKGVRLRVKMYKSYIKGWTQAHIDKEWNIN